MLLISLLTLTALAASTPEEDALKADLSARAKEAISLLAHGGDPETDQAAALLALRLGQLGSAAALIPADGPPWTGWARVELLAKRGMLPDAADLALSQMDAALAGEHRKALVALVVAWAGERALTDPQGARQLLEAAIAMGGVSQVAEDALLALPLDDPGETAWRVAARRLATIEPGGTPPPDVARVVGLRLATRDPAKARALLMAALEGEEPKVAAKALLRLAIPVPEREAALARLTARFPAEPWVSELRLTHARTLLPTEPVPALAELDALFDDPTVGTEARTVAAEGDPTPATRAARWRAIAELAGRSALGTRAAAEGLNALRAEVAAIEDPVGRRARAQAALREPGAAADPDLLWWAAPLDTARPEALRGLASRFPGGPWCGELAKIEVEAGADREQASAWAAACSPEDAYGNALQALSYETPWLTLLAVEGGVDAVVTGAASLSVAQHPVDPLALFAAGDPTPLDSALDAFLVSPARAWTVEAPADHAVRIHIPAQGQDRLAALTVRAADLRATRIVARSELRVLGVHVGGEVAVGVLDHGSPVAGAELTLQSNDEAPKKGRTGADGIARIAGLDGQVRILATRGGGVGFATLDPSPATPAELERVGLVVWESGIEPGGSHGHVTVFDPGGPASRRLTLLSFDAQGGEVDRAQVKLDQGAASASLWMAPDGRVEAREGEVQVATTTTPGAAAADSPVAISVDGDLRTSVRVDVWPRIALPPEGLRIELEVATPWETTHRTVFVERPEAVSSQIPLPAVGPGDQVRVSATVPGATPVYVNLKVPAGPAVAPIPPSRPTALATEPTLAVLHREHIERAWFTRTGDDLTAAVVPGETPAWVVGSGAPLSPVRIEAEAPLSLEIEGSLARGAASTLRFHELPANTRVWAWLTDASDFARVPGQLILPSGWHGSPGEGAILRPRPPVDGEAIAQGLLEEEERMREAEAPSRLDYGFSAAEESYALGGISTRGRGAGGGGYAGDSASGYGRGAGRSGVAGRSPGVDPAVFAALDGVAPKDWSVTLPPWVTRTWVRAVARTPDGRWATALVALPVSGGAVAPYTPPDPPTPTLDGHLDSLLTAAQALPVEGRIVALAGLARAGLPGARPALMAADPQQQDGPATAIAGALLDQRWRTSVGEAALPDPRRAERARQALLLAPTAPDRALAAARRLLTETDLEDGARAEAGLALWMGGAPEAELAQALSGSGPLVAAARALALRPDHARLPTYLRLAGSPEVDPIFRGAALVALAGLPSDKGWGAPEAAQPSSGALTTVVEPPLAEWHGEVFSRGTGGTVGLVPAPIPQDTTQVGLGQRVPIQVTIPPTTGWTRLSCPQEELALVPTAVERRKRCTVVPEALGSSTWEIRLLGQDGTVLGRAAKELEVVPPAGPPATPESPAEAYALGLAILEERPEEGRALLEKLLAEPALSAGAVAQITSRLLGDAIRSGDSARIALAFARYRELVPEGELSLDTAAAFAHAIHIEGDPARAVAAVKVVMDGRFREELAAVDVIRTAGLDLTALKLLRELIFRYPETPTVASARALAPTMLLERANGDGDRLGYTRSSLRHTAAGELARYLVLHPDDEQAPESATLLVETLRQLGDPDRSARVVPGLARRYAASPLGWRLVLAEARVGIARGQAATALKRLDTVTDPVGATLIGLERGRALEALGRDKEAREAYAASATAEAAARLSWLDRRWLPVDPLLIDVDSIPGEVSAGTKARVLATRLELESLLLRDNGQLVVEGIRVEGLTPTADQRVTVGPTGDIPLPHLAAGAYLVSVDLDGSLVRTVLLSQALEVRVQPGNGGALIEVVHPDGRPAAGAQVWVFDGYHTEALRTDPQGTAWTSTGLNAVLAKAGGAYGWRDLDSAESPPPMPAPYQPAYDYEQRSEANGYGELFKQEKAARVQADSL